MAEKFTVNELLRLACLKAEDYETAFLDAISNCQDAETAEARAWSEQFIKRLRAYRLKRWGQTRLEAELETMKSVDVHELLKS